jgi:hypothetical protein
MDIHCKQHSSRTYDRSNLLEYVVHVFMNSRFVSIIINDIQCQRLEMLMTYKPKYRGRQRSCLNLRHCTGSCYTLSEVTKVVIATYSRKEIRNQYRPNKRQDGNLPSFSTTLSTVGYTDGLWLHTCVCVCVYIYRNTCICRIFLTLK